MVHLPPDHGDDATTRREGTREDFRTYMTNPHTLGQTFDFILVDGRARQERFTDWRQRGGGIWVASRTRPITDILDVATHRRLWQAHQRVARVLFLR